MSDWGFLNQHRLKYDPKFYSDSSDGFNGAFSFNIPGEARRVLCIASDGLGWKHVSVSFGPDSKKCPSWVVMCCVKNLFFEDTDWVMQFHPPTSDYVNNHPGCLHLWQPTDKPFPTPDSLLVGIKELGTIK